MSAAKTVTATFAPITYALTVTKAGTGTGTVTSSPAGISCGADCSQAYASGDRRHPDGRAGDGLDVHRLERRLHRHRRLLGDDERGQDRHRHLRPHQPTR